jgi:hypothetical protein
MNYKSIEEIYAGNDKIRERLRSLVSQLTPESMSTLPDGEKWTIAQIIEHIAMVDESTIKICAKLLKKSEEAGHASNGEVMISDGFLQKGVEIAALKVEAPSFVQPTGERTIVESMAKLDENGERLAAMRTQFESVGGTEFKFPHPFFGEISAQEWLALKGGHEHRHIKQIEKILEKIG